jgi:hypothetical protein
MSSHSDPLGRVGLTTLLILAAACSSRSAPAVPTAPATADCTLNVPASAQAQSPARDGAIVVALEGQVDAANAPRPHNRAERLVFSQVYETLVGVDCVGNVVPGLAESWIRGPRGDEWLFTLRGAARFHDGAPVTAQAVVESWTGASLIGEPGSPNPASPIAFAAAVGERMLRVGTKEATSSPENLAAPQLAVHRSGSGRAWPLGTGPFEATDSAGGVLLVPAQTLTTTRIHVRPVAGDPRNAIDAGIDVLVTADPAALNYARSHPSFAVVPLAWDATYVMLIPLTTRVGRDSGRPAVPALVLEELARDAVQVDARVAQPPIPWAESYECVSLGRPGGLRSDRVLYAEVDRTARALAGRIVALMTRPGANDEWMMSLVPERRDRLVAAGLSGDAFAAALRAGGDAAYILPLARAGADPCAQIEIVRESVSVLPLVETRASVIMRRGLAGIETDARGTLLFARARRREAGGGTP